MKSKKIKDIYEGKVARRYDLSMSHFFARLKERAIHSASLKTGDTVLVFCCGTGLDFPEILNQIGKTGKVIGIDFSTEMLQQAQIKIDKYGWKNVELIKEDVTSLNHSLNEKADIGICTLGMSIIPEYRIAYSNLLSNVKKGGKIIIGDMQLASGWKAMFNPITILMAKKFGGSKKGHRNSQMIFSLMVAELQDVSKKSFFMDAYCYCIGTK